MKRIHQEKIDIESNKRAGLSDIRRNRRRNKNSALIQEEYIETTKRLLLQGRKLKGVSGIGALEDDASVQSALNRILTTTAATKQKVRKNGVIPWALLDELDGEKKKWEDEKAFIEFYHGDINLQL